MSPQALPQGCMGRLWCRISSINRVPTGFSDSSRGIQIQEFSDFRV